MPAQRGGNGNGRKDELPASWLSGWFDSELDDLFIGEPELKRSAQMLRAARPEAVADQRFRTRLRASLMAEAQRGQARRRRWFLGPVQLAWTGAGVGIAAIAATILTLFNGPAADHQALVALSNVSAHHSVSLDDVITVAFNQPMDQQAVVAGLHIQPATQVRTTWKGNDLLITPVHHLTGNTPYRVTIDQRHARTASGATARAAIQITFGTAPTAPRTPSNGPPSLTTSNLGVASDGATVIFAPDGSVVVTSSPPPPPSLAPTASGSPPASQPASPSAASAGTSPVLVEYPAVGGPIVLGPAAGAAAFSPNGTLLASVVHYSAGTASLVVSSANGSNPATLAQSQSDITSIAWASNRRLLYATASAIKAVELTGVSHTVAEPPGASSVQLSPDAAWAYLAPVGDAGGQLLDIETGRRQPLAGAGQSVSFSADGTAIGWVDRSQTPQRVQTQLLTTGARVAVSPLDAGDNLDAVALSANATAIAYVERPATGQAHLVVAQLPSGAVVAVGPEVSSVAFSPDGRSLALINSAAPSSTVQRAALPGATEPSEAAGLPASARTAVQAFIDAQVGYDTEALTALSTGAAAAIPSTPKGISRGYLVSAAANSDGSITATAELIVDSSGTHPLPQKSEETVTFARAPGGSAYLVTAVTAGPLRDELPGPHVVTVTTVVQHGGAVVQINFDSDLERSSVPAAITLVTSDGTVLAGQVVYDADTRSATVTLAAVPSSPITVNVGASLRDVDGQAIAGSFATRAGF